MRKNLQHLILMLTTICFNALNAQNPTSFEVTQKVIKDNSFYEVPLKVVLNSGMGSESIQMTVYKKKDKVEDYTLQKVSDEYYREPKNNQYFIRFYNPNAILVTHSAGELFSFVLCSEGSTCKDLSGDLKKDAKELMGNIYRLKDEKKKAEEDKLLKQGLVKSNALVQKNTNEIGLFINKGNTKIESLDCYDFDDLMVAFKTKTEMFSYDQITVTIRLLNKKNMNSSFYQSVHTDKEVFNTLFNKRKTAKVWIFKDPSSLDEFSDFKFYRHQLELTDDKNNMDQYYMRIEVAGATFKGYKSSYDSYNRSITEKTYTYKDMYILEIPMAKKYTKDAFTDRTLTKQNCYPVNNNLSEAVDPIK